MSNVIYSRYQMPFLQGVFESLIVLTYCVALFPGAYLSMFIITIPLTIGSLVLSHIQQSKLIRYSFLNVIVSLLLIYTAYQVIYSLDSKFILTLINSLLTLAGIALSIITILTVARDVSQHHKAVSNFRKHEEPKKVADIKPVFSTKKKK